MAQGVLNTGLELVHKATQHDYGGRFAEACYLYDLSLEYFRKALQNIDRPETRAQISTKINEYENRCNQLKQHAHVTQISVTPPAVSNTVPSYTPQFTAQPTSPIPIPVFEHVKPTSPQPIPNRPLVINRVGSSPALSSNKAVPIPSSVTSDKSSEKTKARGSSADSVMAIENISLSAPSHGEYINNKKANKSDGNLMGMLKTKLGHHKRHTEPTNSDSHPDAQLELAIHFLQEADKEVDPMKAMAMYKNASHMLLQHIRPSEPVEDRTVPAPSLSNSSDNNQEDITASPNPKKRITIDWKTDEVIFHEILGGGGSGAQIYRCTCKGFTFAAKVMRTENVQEVIEAIKREIKIMMRLDNQHVVSYLGHELKPAEIRLYMEFYTHTLHDILKDRRTQQRPFTPQQIAQYMFQVAQGLCYLHNNDPPIIHRDLKSENVFVTLDPQRNILCLKIGDFDSSKMLETAKVTYTKNQGTEGFMAPEVCAVKTKGYSEKADIFSFGMVMFEMMTLEKPYSDVPLAQKWAVMEKGTRPTMSDAVRAKYKSLLPVWEKCTALSPSDRPTAKKLLKKLTKVMVAN